MIILYRILPAFVCLCLLSGCTPKPQPRTPALARYAVSFVGPLDTVTNFTAYCPTQAVFDQITRYNMVLKVDYLIVSNGMQHYCCRMDYENQSYTFLQDIPDYKSL